MATIVSCTSTSWCQISTSLTIACLQYSQRSHSYSCSYSYQYRRCHGQRVVSRNRWQLAWRSRKSLFHRCVLPERALGTLMFQTNSGFMSAVSDETRSGTPWWSSSTQTSRGPSGLRPISESTIIIITIISIVMTVIIHAYIYIYIYIYIIHTHTLDW